VLESSATRRDAKAYLQTFGGSSKKPAVKHEGIRAVSDSPRFIQGPAGTDHPGLTGEAPHIAIVKLKDPQAWNDTLIDGIARTLTQLRDLGLVSVIVPACTDGSKEMIYEQIDRLLLAIGKHGSPGAQLVDSGIYTSEKTSHSVAPGHLTNIFVGFKDGLTALLRNGHILIVPPRAYSEESLRATPTNSDDMVLALARFFSGLQFNSSELQGCDMNGQGRMASFKKALVDRIIVIDPLGGIPSSKEKDGARVFINLEEEFGHLRDALNSQSPATGTNHLENLDLVKSTLAILPSTSSAVITSPAEAANLRGWRSPASDHAVGWVTGQVGTRPWQNPLIHNLLTDRPMYSSSLPIGRIKQRAANGAELTVPRMPTTTLAKKGLPVTIFPDSRASPWRPPKPGSPRLRLTDTCIDLPRLIHLINDSFNRELDAEHYLRRLEDSLAGIIIAGEYEGGAILTWERPFGLTEEAAYSQGRLVPYLDKFAVLKKSQGAGGVADIVFNAMVRDCFPGGVCWRSRRNNPVNKWYFERSSGVRKLPESNWAMFWTNPDAALDEQLMTDYEDVCRNVVPSWADGKQAD